MFRRTGPEFPNPGEVKEFRSGVERFSSETHLLKESWTRGIPGNPSINRLLTTEEEFNALERGKSVLVRMKDGTYVTGKVKRAPKLGKVGVDVSGKTLQLGNHEVIDLGKVGVTRDYEVRFGVIQGIDLQETALLKLKDKAGQTEYVRVPLSDVHPVRTPRKGSSAIAVDEVSGEEGVSISSASKPARFQDTDKTLVENIQGKFQVMGADGLYLRNADGSYVFKTLSAKRVLPDAHSGLGRLAQRMQRDGNLLVLSHDGLAVSRAEGFYKGNMTIIGDAEGVDKKKEFASIVLDETKVDQAATQYVAGHEGFHGKKTIDRGAALYQEGFLQAEDGTIFAYFNRGHNGKSIQLYRTNYNKHGGGTIGDYGYRMMKEHGQYVILGEPWMKCSPEVVVIDRKKWIEATQAFRGRFFADQGKTLISAASSYREFLSSEELHTFTKDLLSTISADNKGVIRAIETQIKKSKGRRWGGIGPRRKLEAQLKDEPLLDSIRIPMASFLDFRRYHSEYQGLKYVTGVVRANADPILEAIRAKDPNLITNVVRRKYETDVTLKLNGIQFEVPIPQTELEPTQYVVDHFDLLARRAAAIQGQAEKLHELILRLQKQGFATGREYLELKDRASALAKVVETQVDFEKLRTDYKPPREE